MAALSGNQLFAKTENSKLRVGLVGTGVRGISMWGQSLVKDYGDVIEFVGLSDINPGRLQYGREYIGVDCPTFTNFDKMLETVPMESCW